VKQKVFSSIFRNPAGGADFKIGGKQNIYKQDGKFY